LKRLPTAILAGDWREATDCSDIKPGEADNAESIGGAVRFGACRTCRLQARRPLNFSVKNAFVSYLLSFLHHYIMRPILDEWLLSTLFDASLLSLEPPATAALFWAWYGCPFLQADHRIGNYLLKI